MIKAIGKPDIKITVLGKATLARHPVFLFTALRRLRIVDIPAKPTGSTVHFVAVLNCQAHYTASSCTGCTGGSLAILTSSSRASSVIMSVTPRPVVAALETF